MVLQQRQGRAMFHNLFIGYRGFSAHWRVYMILRRIQLMEPRNSDGMPAFKDELRLWVDGVTDKSVQTLESFLEEKYQLKAEVPKGEMDVEGYRMIEFGNNSLYQLNMPGNLCLEYAKLQSTFDTQDTSIRVLQELNEGRLLRGSKFETAEAYQIAQLDYVARAGKRQEQRMLRSILKEGRSVLVEVVADPEYAIAVGLYDAPKNYPKNPQITGSLMRLKFLPFAQQKDRVKELRNLLLGEDMTYETPRHKEVLDGVLSGEIFQYNGQALFEYREWKGRIGFTDAS